MQLDSKILSRGDFTDLDSFGVNRVILRNEVTVIMFCKIYMRKWIVEYFILLLDCISLYEFFLLYLKISLLSLWNVEPPM